MAMGGTPRRRIPDSVGIRGSSQPATCPSFTNRRSLRFDSTVEDRLSRANSIWRGADGTERCWMSQS